MQEKSTKTPRCADCALHICEAQCPPKFTCKGRCPHKPAMVKCFMTVKECKYFTRINWKSHKLFGKLS
jgi:hypothetical protein